nr:MAG TPA: hypothetical protein [Caudoviricetes sp.]
MEKDIQHPSAIDDVTKTIENVDDIPAEILAEMSNNKEEGE